MIPSPIRVLVVDDEPPARQRVVDLLANEPTAVMVGECASGLDALDAMPRERPDLVYLDVQMPGCSGLDVVRRLDPSHTPMIVFTTGYDDYAVEAFDAHAIDFLLKPYSDERFHESWRRATAQLNAVSLASLRTRLVDWLATLPTPSSTSVGVAPDDVPHLPGRIAVRVRGRTHLIAAKDIVWIEADRDRVKLHLDRDTHLMRGSLGDVMAQLDTQGFVRVHRSAAVQIARVREVIPAFRNEDVLLLETGARVRVSRTFRAEVRSRLGIPS